MINQIARLHCRFDLVLVVSNTMCYSHRTMKDLSQYYQTETPSLSEVTTPNCVEHVFIDPISESGPDGWFLKPDY